MIRLAAFRELGFTDKALGCAHEALERSPVSACPWGLVNLVVDALVSAGRYAEAIDAPDRWSSRAQERGRKLDPVSFCFTKINQAEALYNQGHAERALVLLQSTESVLADLDPGRRDTALARNGLLCLRAWILVHQRRLDAARARLSEIEASGLIGYAAELEYTWAALARECGDFRGALSHAERGLAAAARASSRRNGLLMIAPLAMLSGDTGRALSVFEDAIADPYRGQGGDGLLRFAELLELRGDLARARRVYALIVERDPQSVFASSARAKLTDGGPVSESVRVRRRLSRADAHCASGGFGGRLVG